MRRAAGQAALLAGRRLHFLGQAALALTTLALLVLAAIAWRLDQGPLPVPWVAHLLERTARAHGFDLSVGRATLAWKGFSHGIGVPVDLGLRDVTLRQAGVPAPMRAARIDAAFGIGRLIEGQVMPVSLSADDVQLALTRDPAGGLALGVGASTRPPPTLRLDQRAPPVPGRRGALDWRALRHLHAHGVRVAVYDAQIGLSWRITEAEADLDRDAQGAIRGHARIALAAATQQATLTLDAAADAGSGSVTATLTPLDPAALAGLSPAFAGMAMLDAPVTLSARAAFDPAFHLRHGHLSAQVGAGTVHAGTGSAPLLAATIEAEATPDALDASQRLETAAAPDRPHTVITGTLRARRGAGGGWQATETAAVDHLDFADLPALWPAGTGGPGSRPWITHNITAGVLANGHLSLTLAVPADLSDARLLTIRADIDGHDLTVHWLRPVPPIEHAEGHLTVTDPDVIDVAVSSARQARPGGGDGLSFSHALVHLTGIAGNDQFADIGTDLSGGLPDLIAVLKHPRIKLLDRRPVPMHDPAGRFTARLSVDHLPLRDDVAMDDLQIATKAHFTGVHLGGIAAGRDLSDGVLALSADNDGLQASGTASLAGIASTLHVAMDFRAGPPSQVEQSVRVSGVIDVAQLAALGLPSRGVMTGGMAVRASVESRRDGRTDIEAAADLTRAGMDVARLGYSKPQGQAVQASLHVQLDHDRLAAIDQVQVHGAGIDIEGGAEMAQGRPQVLRLDRVLLASPTDPRATDLSGTITLPQQVGAAYQVALSGASLDASGVFARGSAAAKPKRAAAPSSGPPWSLDARLGRVLLGPDQTVSRLDARIENDGRIVRSAHLSGVTQSPAPRGAVQRPGPFVLTITPEPGGRRLDATAADAGGLLRVLDIADDLSGGRMTVSAHYDDAAAAHPLSGTATLQDFRVLNAPVIGRVLQAATLYGLIEVLRGPGLGFIRMVAPFRLEDDVLSLDGARAFSASLGFTAKGSADLARRTLDMTGTIVPAYALNTLPGRIPLIGRLFSPERGGGLFAATYSVRGPFASPSVGVNPLATLTPGFLRGLFGLFGGGRASR